MAALDPTDSEVMTMTKSGTTQFLFSDVLMNSASSAEWRKYEVGFAKSIVEQTRVTSKSEDLKSNGKTIDPANMS